MSVICAISLLLGMVNHDEPSFIFSVCEKTDCHVAVQKTNDHTYLVHFHVKVQGMAGKQAFAQVRCSADQGMDAPIMHNSSKVVSIKKQTERWGFWLYVPRSASVPANKVTYQIEIGAFDPSNVDEYQIRDTFAWTFREGKMFTGNNKEAVFIPRTIRTIVVENGEFRIRTVHETSVKVTSLRYSVTTKLQPPQDGLATAQRTDP